MKRRTFFKISLGSAAGITLQPSCLWAEPSAPRTFAISLAEWSLVKSLRSGKLDHLDFPRVAKERFGINCVEFVDQFFADKARDLDYLSELKQRGAEHGVKLGLIMIDTTGNLGADSERERGRAVDRTLSWIDAARHLSCHAIRINARGPQDPDRLRRNMIQSGRRLADHDPGINVVIENHGGLSSDPAWLASTIQAVDRPNFGALPDFGNFPPSINRYHAVETLMPHALAVSAKATSFAPDGEILDTDFPRMMRIVRDGGYHGHVGIETSAPSQATEYACIGHVNRALRAIREQQARCQPIFDGNSLEGWTPIGGGQWTVQDGVLIGRNGKGWSHNPDVAGSWLSTTSPYEDFRFEFQYRINEGGNSGVFFRSSRERNPAFNGYEFQIYDAPGAPPSKHGPGAIYDKAAPTKNRVRPAGQWNTVTLVAVGPAITVEMNGETVLRTELHQSMKGYLGLQIHDENTEVRFRNLRVERL